MQSLAMYSVGQFCEQLEANYRGALAAASSSPADSQVATFSKSVRDLSGEVFRYVQDVLCLNIPEVHDPRAGLAVLLTGSDGRAEKSSATSQVEIIVVAEGKSLSGHALATKEKIAYFVTHEGACLFHGDVEVKCLERDEISVYEMVGRKCIPTRALDAKFLAGDPILFIKYKKKLFVELSNSTNALSQFKKGFLKPALKTIEAEIKVTPPSPTKTGSPKKPKKLLDVDVLSGALRADGHRLKGPKFGLMRAVQYSAAMVFFRNISHIKEEELFSIPSSVLERIDWLKSKNFVFLSDEECSLLKNCYMQGLLWYGALCSQPGIGKASQENPVTITVPPLLLRSTLQNTQNLVMKLLAGQSPELFSPSLEVVRKRSKK